MMNMKLLKCLLVPICLLAIAATAAGQDSLKIYISQGGVLLKNNEYSKARDSYTAALRLDPDNFEAVKNLGAIYSTLGDNRQAKVYLERALSMNSAAADVANNLGAVYSKEGNGPKAIEHYEQAVALAPGSAVYKTNLGQEYAKIGRVSKAIPILHEARALAPANPIIPFSLGSAFASAGSLDSAEVYFQKSIDLGGHTAELHYFMGTVKNRLGKPDEAEQHYLSSLQLTPNHRNTLQSLGLIYLSSDRFPAAIEQFGRVVANDSTFWGAWIGLGAAYSLNGMVPSADTILQRLFAVDSTMGFQMLNIISAEHSKLRAKEKAADTSGR